MMNLWPDIEDETELQPYEVLESQVKRFNEEFGGNPLTAHFEKLEIAGGEWLCIRHKNGNDLFELLSVTQSDNYPCTVQWEGGKTRAKTEAEFIGLVAKILTHQKTRMAIAGLMKK